MIFLSSRSFTIGMIFIIICFFVMLIPSPISPSNLDINQSSQEKTNEKQDSPETDFKNEIIVGLIMLIVGGVLGFFATRWLNRDTIKFQYLTERYNHIRDFFIGYMFNIINLESTQDDKAGEIVIMSINNTAPLIQDLFFHISKRKSKKIIKHYEEYTKYYEDNPFDTEKLREFEKHQSIIYPKTYSFTKVENARDKAIKSLQKLIDDFNHI